ncbi:MAG: 50S ribosomal protein L37ae [Candidatus Methanomethylicota archaeon]|nr:MAG: 50S ribosomal protein L37ae [Candidatus Verstraetearchaeota archaeon]
MLGRTRKVGITGRFGARYGSTVRSRVRKIEEAMRAPHRCPRCKSRGKLKRLSIGIWTCKKCGYTFAGGAYVPFSSLIK